MITVTYDDEALSLYISLKDFIPLKTYVAKGSGVCVDTTTFGTEEILIGVEIIHLPSLADLDIETVLFEDMPIGIEIQVHKALKFAQSIDFTSIR